MPDTHDHGPTPHHAPPQPAAPAPLTVAGGEVVALPTGAARLLGDPRLAGRGNSPVRAAVVQRLQQTVGNRATRALVAVQRGKDPLTNLEQQRIATAVEQIGQLVAQGTHDAVLNQLTFTGFKSGQEAFAKMNCFDCAIRHGVQNHEQPRAIIEFYEGDWNHGFLVLDVGELMVVDTSALGRSRLQMSAEVDPVPLAEYLERALHHNKEQSKGLPAFRLWDKDQITPRHHTVHQS